MQECFESQEGSAADVVFLEIVLRLYVVATN